MAKVWKKGQPHPSLAFHTKRVRDFGIGTVGPDLLFPEEHIRRITTSNKMNGEGSFSIELVFYKIKPDDPEPFYYSVVQPLDVVEIQLDSSDTTMMGMVDKVKKVIRMTKNGPMRTVRITGRSLAAIWRFDLIKYYQNAIIATDDLQQKKIFLDNNIFLQKGAIAFDFFEKPPYTAVMEIHDKLPTFDMQLYGGNVSNYLDVGSELFARSGELVFNSQISPYSGSIWDYFAKYFQIPFYEFWTESRDHKLYLRARPTPFSLTDEEEGENPMGVKKLFGWNQIKTWIGNEDYHNIEPSDIRDEDMEIDHSNAYSHFAVLPSDRFVGKDAEYAAFKPLIDFDLAREIGVRDMQVRLNYIPLTRDGSTTAGTGGTLERHDYYRNKSYLWNRDNHRMESGTLTIKGNPKIRVGDKVRHAALAKHYYVLGVDNNYVYGEPFTTTIEVDRGLTNPERSNLYQAGLDFVERLG